MAHPRRSPWLAAGAAALLTAGLLFAVGESAASAAGSVSKVTGSAYGFRTFDITLFGGAQQGVGPTPTVTLAANASNSPQSATAATGIVQYGPATLFTADASSVETSGSLGATGSVSSKSSVKDLNKATTQTSTGSEALTAGAMAGSCSASTSGTSGSTTITSGTLQTDNGLDLNNDGNYTDPGEHPPVTVPLPANPAPNTSISGHVHISATSQDNFHNVFNEQSTSGGVLTVNPVHEYFDGPNLKGSLVVGQVVCGVAGTTTAASSTSSRSTTTSASTTVPTPATGGGVGRAAGAATLIAVVAGGGLLAGAVAARRRGRARGDQERS